MRRHPFAAPIAAVAIALLCAGPSSADGTRTAEQQAVVDVVTSAYVDGIHNFRDPERIRGGFHPGFEMLILRDGELSRLTIGEWIERIEAQNAKQPPPADGTRTTSAELPVVEVSGDAASCRVELTRDGKHVFTDFLLLYRFEDGWKIVGKTFQRHG